MEGFTHLFLQDFIKRLTKDSYFNGLCRSIKVLKIGAPSKLATSKTKLIEFVCESSYSNLTDDEVAGYSKKKKKLCSDSDLKDVSSVLWRLSISDEVFGPLEAEETSSNIKIKNKTKKRKEKEMQSKRQKKNCYCFFLFLFFLFQGVMFKCIKFGKCFSYRYSKKPTDIYKTLEKKKKLQKNRMILFFQNCSHQSFTNILAMSINTRCVTICTDNWQQVKKLCFSCMNFDILLHFIKWHLLHFISNFRFVYFTHVIPWSNLH